MRTSDVTVSILVWNLNQDQLNGPYCRIFTCVCVCVCAGNNDVKLDEKQKCKVNDTAPPPLHIIFYFNIPNIHQLSEHSSVSITFVVIVQTMPWAVKLKELKVCHHTFFFLVCLPAESWSVNIRWEFNSCWGFFFFPFQGFTNMDRTALLTGLDMFHIKRFCGYLYSLSIFYLWTQSCSSLMLWHGTWYFLIMV